MAQIIPISRARGWRGNVGPKQVAPPALRSPRGTHKRVGELERLADKAQTWLHWNANGYRDPDILLGVYRLWLADCFDAIDAGRIRLRDLRELCTATRRMALQRSMLPGRHFAFRDDALSLARKRWLYLRPGGLRRQTMEMRQHFCRNDLCDGCQSPHELCTGVYRYQGKMCCPECDHEGSAEWLIQNGFLRL